MKYSDYQLSDFLKDEFFIKWVKNNDAHVNDFWKKWIATNPEKLLIIQEAKDIAQSIEYKETHTLPSEAYVDMYEKILKESDARFYRKSTSYAFKIAASLLLITVFSFVIWVSIISTKEEKTPQAVGLVINKSTLPGQKLTFKLPDGTLVKLNAASTLQFSQPADSSRRDVYLDGEAFFDVTKDLTRPFIVKTNETSTTALGTSFNINAYSIEDNHKISLLTGRVLVKKTSENHLKESEILLPGDQVIYNRDNNSFQKVHFDLEREVAWSKGVIVFKDTDFENVMLTLGRWYGVQFEVINESKKAKDKFSGVFENESLERVLEVLSYSGGFSFKLKDDDVVIEFYTKN